MRSRILPLDRIYKKGFVQSLANTNPVICFSIAQPLSSLSHILSH
jgi:hypothetical protein